jgi:hypothetical protein
LPFFFDAAILSRIRSPVTSSSNWAKDNSTLSLSLELVVLNCWVSVTQQIQYDELDGTAHAQRAVVLCPVRAGGHR